MGVGFIGWKAGITDGFDFGWPVGVSTAVSIDGRFTETGQKEWANDDGSTIAIFAPSDASGLTSPTPPALGFPAATIDAEFSDGTIYVEVQPIKETGDPGFRNGLIFRYVDPSNFWVWYNFRSPVSGLYYALGCYSGGSIVYDSGVLTTGVRDVDPTIPMEVILDGSSIEAYYDGVLRQNITNSTHLTATRHGIMTYGYGVAYFSASPVEP